MEPEPLIFLHPMLEKIFDLIFSRSNIVFFLQSMELCREFLVEKKQQCKCDLITDCCFICIFQFLELVDKMMRFNLKMFAFRASIKYKYKYYFGCSLYSIGDTDSQTNLDLGDKNTKQFFSVIINDFKIKKHLYSPFSFEISLHPSNIHLNCFKKIKMLKYSMGLYYFGLRSEIRTTVCHKFKENILVFLENEIKVRSLIEDDTDLLELFEQLQEHFKQTKPTGIKTFVNIFEDWFNNFKNIKCKK